MSRERWYEAPAASGVLPVEAKLPSEMSLLPTVPSVDNQTRSVQFVTVGPVPWFCTVQATVMVWPKLALGGAVTTVGTRSSAATTTCTVAALAALLLSSLSSSCT